MSTLHLPSDWKVNERRSTMSEGRVRGVLLGLSLGMLSELPRYCGLPKVCSLSGTWEGGSDRKVMRGADRAFLRRLKENLCEA